MPAYPKGTFRVATLKVHALGGVQQDLTELRPLVADLLGLSESNKISDSGAFVDGEIRYEARGVHNLLVRFWFPNQWGAIEFMTVHSGSVTGYVYMEGSKIMVVVE
ncbi:MAG TPA: hypothetical protein VFZ48_03975 [Candidatus Saccharimonadales bacterium]